MSVIKAYDIKARKKVVMKNPQPYRMKNGTWALKGLVLRLESDYSESRGETNDLSVKVEYIQKVVSKQTVRNPINLR